jgi:hypothetical protein
MVASLCFQHRAGPLNVGVARSDIRLIFTGGVNSFLQSDNTRLFTADGMRVLRRIGNSFTEGFPLSDPSVTDYVLEEPAECPNCRREIVEKILIEPV